MTTYTNRRPLVVDLRDWLACLVLLLASAFLLGVMLLGIDVGDAVAPAPPTTKTIPVQLVPDPGSRPSPMPGPPVHEPR